MASESLLATFDVDNIPVEALMFQAGYLTIAGHRQILGRLELTLKHPNLEVQAALNDSLLQSLTGGMTLPCQGRADSPDWRGVQQGEPPYCGV